MSALVSFPTIKSISKQRSYVIQGNGNTSKLEKLKLMIEKLEKENKEYLKTNQHLTQKAKLVYQQNKKMKDAFNDRTSFYEQMLDKYSRSIRILQTATDNNKKMSEIYQRYKSRLNNSNKSNDDCIFNPEIDKIDREIKNIQISANELIKKFHESDTKIFNYRILFSLDTKLDHINRIFTNEAKNCISANPCFFSNSRLDKLQQKINKGDKIKKELFEEDKSEETEYALKKISEKFDRCLSIYNQILLITKKRKLMSEDDLEGLSKNDGFSCEKVESKVPQNFGYDDEIFELKRIVELGGFDYLNDLENSENYKKIKSLFIPGFNSSFYKSTESTESYDSERENNDEKLLDSSESYEYEEEEDEEEEFSLFDQKKNKLISIKVEDPNLKNENVCKKNVNQPKSKQIYLPIWPIYQQPIYKQNSPRIHLIKDTKMIDAMNQKEKSSEEINVEDELSSEYQLYSSDFEASSEMPTQKETEKSDTSFECILNREENHSESSFLSGRLEISSSSEDPFYSSPTENEDKNMKKYQKSESESDSLIEDDYLSERAFLSDKFHLSDEQNKKSSKDEKIDSPIPTIERPFSLLFGPYKSDHSPKLILEELEEDKSNTQPEKHEKRRINIQLEELEEDSIITQPEKHEKRKINIQLEELESDELEKELCTKHKVLEPPKLKVKKPNSLLIRPNKSRQRSFVKSSQKKPTEESDFSLESDLHSVTSSDAFVLSSSQQSMKSEEEIIEPLIPRGRKREKTISYLYSKLKDEDDSGSEFILKEPDSESDNSKEEDNQNQTILSPLRKQRVSTYDPTIFYPTSTIYPRTKFDYFPTSNEKMPLTVSLKDIGLEGFDSCKIEKMKELQRIQKVRKEEEQKMKNKSRILVDEKNYSISTNSEVICKLSINGRSSTQRKEKMTSFNRKKMDQIEPYVDSNQHLPTSLLNSTQKAQKVHAIKIKTVPKTCSRISKSKSSVVDGNQLNSLLCRSPRRYSKVKND